MKIMLKTLIIVCLMALNTSVLFAQKAKTQGKVYKTNPPKRFDYGTVEGTIYTNKYFGMRFESPETWEIPERTYGEEAVKIGKDLVKAKTSQIQTGMDKSVEQTKSLFATKKGVGTSNYASVLCYAELLGNSTLITSGTDYLRAALNLYKKTILPPDFAYSETIKQDKLGKNTLPYFETSKGLIKQRYYAIIRKGYGVSFIFTYFENEDLETMRKMLENADFSMK